MKKVISSLCLILLLSSCGLTGLNPFSSKGGPTVNANVLAGKENTQQVVAQQNRQDAGRDIVTTEITKEVETERVEKLQITKTNIPPWVLLLLILGWLLPTPTQIGMWFGNLFLSIFKRRKT
jgi:predicted small lipoprotein YifL